MTPSEVLRSERLGDQVFSNYPNLPDSWRDADLSRY
jgi:hypothetical protein